ncbi:SDR family oxidoreductase [Motilimonas pumila]|uniref:NAD-dependent epimerase/dehydratase family protein n=1 Tax=Motilimonas pumila TaxID=2303987 RepID=A0A418YK12_9GAMM|nr:NAD(P)H-binding protein [Motilimonas pumila]RJG51170.1 NAD-dependent epimerase/dehydratase family protein [Motilimonas pumila]
MKTIAVIGASGMLGQPVVNALLQANFNVVAIASNLTKLKAVMPSAVICRQADVRDLTQTQQALKGCDGVHISLAAFSPAQSLAIQEQGCRNIVTAAKQQKLSRITYLSGTTSFANNAWHYDTQGKLAAEQAIKQSGLDYLIYCPSWFMETLPQFVQNRRATIFGPADRPIKWLCANDYADIVCRSYQQSKLLNTRLYLHGPQAHTMASAIKRYSQAQQPEIAVSRLPFWAGKGLAWLSRDEKLKDAMALLAYYQQVQEAGDPEISNQAFGAPRTELDQWLAAQA